MLSRRCTRAIIRAVRDALCQLIMTSFAKQLTTAQILSRMKLEKLGRMWCLLAHASLFVIY